MKYLILLILLFSINVLASDYDISIEGGDNKVTITIYKGDRAFKMFTTYEELNKYLKNEPNKIKDFAKAVVNGN